ncbi:MAG: hypothetical protein ACKVOK_05175 [Flavobacteriales bacterium]
MNRRRKFIAGSLAAVITFTTLMVVASPYRRHHRHMHHQGCQQSTDGHYQGECMRSDSTATIQ